MSESEELLKILAMENFLKRIDSVLNGSGRDLKKIDAIQRDLDTAVRPKRPWVPDPEVAWIDPVKKRKKSR